jgi:hypothetical protein
MLKLLGQLIGSIVALALSALVLFMCGVAAGAFTIGYRLVAHLVR